MNGDAKLQASARVQARSNGISLRRDQIDRIVARSLGLAGLAAGAAKAIFGHDKWGYRVGALLSGVAFALWMFDTVRRVPKPDEDQE